MYYFVGILQACTGMKIEASPALPDVRDIGSNAPNVQVDPQTISQVNAGTAIRCQLTPDAHQNSRGHHQAVKGNLFIRRGPDMAFNPVGVLYEGTSAVVIAQDMLSDWVQIEIPDSTGTGWVSVQTRYSAVNGDLDSLPGFTPTEWPIAAYLRNCTHHRMYILPGEIILPSYYERPENEVWLYPGRYTVYDLDVPDEPVVMDVDMREGVDVEVKVDGLVRIESVHDALVVMGADIKQYDTIKK